MKIVAISDTHENKLQLPECDVLVHAGDLVMDFNKIGKIDEFKAFLDWFSSQPAKFKLFIAGNHDFQLYYKESREICFDLLEKHKKFNTFYLEDSWIDIDGIKFYGTPWQPYFYGYAFNVKDDSQRYEIFNNMPNDVNFLITHCPPKNQLDKIGNENVGCPSLEKVCKERKDIKYHVFGHIHVHGGKIQKHLNTTYINAALAGSESPYVIEKSPIIFEY